MSIIEGRNAEILQSIIDGKPYENTNPYPSRIEQLLMELKEVIEQGGTTVDQTYSPTSENAQSGTAVAEALGTIPSVTVDQTFDATSANAQSGTAVAQALAAEKMKKIFSATFLYQWSSTGTDINVDFNQRLILQSNKLYVVVIYDSVSYHSTLASMLIEGGTPSAAANSAFAYFDNPNIITGLASFIITDFLPPKLKIKLGAISTTSSQFTGKVEVYEIGYDNT